MMGSSHIAAFARFAFVGGSFALGYAVLTAALIRFAQAPPLITSIIVYLICIPLAFLAQKRFAFRASDTGRAAIFGYAATQVASLTVVSGITSRFVTRNFLIDTGLFVVTAGSAAVASYLICRFIIFRQIADKDAQ